MTDDETIWYLLDGINAEPWTAPSVSVGRGKGGKVYPTIYKNEQLRSYQEAIAEYMEKHYPDAPVLTGPIELDFFIWRQRAEWEAETKKVKRNQVDATNCQKALEDALQGYLFPNDREVASVHTTMMEQESDTYPRILIGVRPARLPTWPADKMLDMVKLLAVERHPSAPDHGVERPDDFF